MMLSTAAVEARSGGRLTQSVAFVILMLFSLWDFYVPDVAIRPFDFVATTALLIVVLLSFPRPARLRSDTFAVIAVFWGVTLLYGLIGVADAAENVRPMLGVLIGAMVLSCAVAWVGTDINAVGKALVILVAVHCAAFWLQLTVFYASGYLINFHSWLGAEPRVFGKAFRACGLFLEPAHMALTLFLLTTFRYALITRIDRWIIVATITAIASMSLWGIIAFLGFLVIVVSLRTIIIAGAIGCVVLATLVITLQNLESFWLVERLLTLGKDGSGFVRYGVLFQGIVNEFWTPAFWLGSGISNDYLAFGASGMGFLLKAIGLMGVIVVATLVCVLTQLHRRVWLAYAFLIGLTATTVWTYMIWWFWLGLMIYTLTMSRDSDESIDSVGSQT